VAAAGPDVIATANPGCALQIASACRDRGTPCRVVHPIELLDMSIQNKEPGPFTTKTVKSVQRTQPDTSSQT
jgi:hypothetical protein